MSKLSKKHKLLIISGLTGVLFIIILAIAFMYILTLENNIMTISTMNEDKIIKNAVMQYKKDKATSGEPDVQYDENGMTLTDERYGNAGMPKTLVLKGVPILCFEWANIGDESKCTEEQLNTIEAFFKENKNLDWDKEYFEY
jgi:hypothetical protein